MSKATKYYLVTEDDLKTLLRESFELNALQSGGVDNWEWFSDSIADSLKDYNTFYSTNHETIDEIVEDDIKNFKHIICYVDKPLI